MRWQPGHSSFPLHCSWPRLSAQLAGAQLPHWATNHREASKPCLACASSKWITSWRSKPHLRRPVSACVVQMQFMSRWQSVRVCPYLRLMPIGGNKGKRLSRSIIFRSALNRSALKKRAGRSEVDPVFRRAKLKGIAYFANPKIEC